MKRLIILLVLGLLAGCGGGGSGSTSGGSTVTTDTVSGIAAAGAVISGTVSLKDSAATPKELTKTIATDGSYSFDVTGMTKPYLLKAVGTANGTNYTLFSMATDKGTANINPMTHLVVANAAGGTDPATIYNAAQTATMLAMAGKLPQAVTDVQTSLNPLLTTYSSATVNPITDSYKADHTGLDGMLDKVKIDISNGTVTITNASTGATIFSGQVANIRGGTVTAGNIPQPSTPGGGGANGLTNAYFPATVGSTWTYSATFGASTSQDTEKITANINNVITKEFPSSTGKNIETISVGSSVSESPPKLRTVRKAATTADGGHPWYREESRTPASLRLKR